MKKRVARILIFKIRPSQEILKIPDGTPLEAEEILTYKKSPRNESVWYFSSKLDVRSKVLQKKRVAWILVFKIRPSQEILKIRDGTPLEMSSQEIHKIRDDRPSQEIHKIRDEINKIRDDVPSNVLQKKRVARILIFKIRPSQEILKIPDGTPLEAEEILTYKKSPRNESVWYFSSKLDVRSKVLQKKRVAWILVFKIRPSQEILKIRDGTPLEMSSQEIHKIRDEPSQEIHKIRDGTPLEKKRVAQILIFEIRPFQEILKIRDGTPLEAEEILTYKKSSRNESVWYFSSKLDVPSKVLQKKRVARILVFKIRPSQEILKIRDGTHLEMSSQEIHKIRDVMYYRRKEWHEFYFSNFGHLKKFSKFVMDPFGGGINFDIQKKALKMDRFEINKIRDEPFQEILKIPDGTPLEAEKILTYKKSSRNESVWYFSSKLDVPSKVLQKKRVARILVFKIRPSQEILKIRDVKKRVARILFFKIRSSQEIHKIHDGTPLEAEEILTYKKSPRNESVWYFSSKLDVRSKVLQKKRVAWILVFKIRPSQEILKIRDGTPLEKRVVRILVFKIRSSQEIHKIRDGTLLEKKRVARILIFKIRPSQEILKIPDGTPLEAEEILTYKKSPRNESVWYFSSKLDVRSKVLQKKRVAWILVFKIRPSQEILKIRDGTPLEMSSQEIHKIRDGTLLEWPSQEIHKIRDDKLDVPSNVLQKKGVAQILIFEIRPFQEILKIRDGTPLEAEEILTYKKSSRNESVWYFSSKLDVPSKVLQKKRVARILVFKIRPSQEILKIRDGTHLEAEEILTYRKKP
ncbi:hypothetical protein OROHE_006999 [Orobanche hederae]